MDVVEADGLRVANADFKAALKFMLTTFKQQSHSMHRHVKREHGDWGKIRHGHIRDCPALPCTQDRKDIALVQAVLDEYSDTTLG